MTAFPACRARAGARARLRELLLACDERDEAVDLGLPDRSRDIRVCDPDAAGVVERDRMRAGELRERRTVVERELTSRRQPGDCAILAPVSK